MEKQLTARNMSRATFIAGTTLAAAAGLGLMTSSAKADDSSKAAEAEAPVAPEAPSSYTPGTYIGTATGNSGRVVVETVLGDSMAIEGVRILSHSETDHLMYAVEQILPARIVEAQSLDVDGVTGATITSFAVKSAVEDCIAQAGGDVAQLNEAPAPEAAPESLSCQVFIVGTGAAGLVAAVELQHAGADVLLVEQQDFAGGCTRFSYGRMFAALDEEGIDNIRNEFLKQTTVGQRPYDEAEFPNMDKVDQYVTEGYEAMVFMRDVMGLPLEYYGWVEGNERSTYDVSCTKVHLGANDFEAYSGSKGFQLVETLLATYENLGGRVMFGTKVTGLVQGGGRRGDRRRSRDGGRPYLDRGRLRAHRYGQRRQQPGDAGNLCSRARRRRGSHHQHGQRRLGHPDDDRPEGQGSARLD